MDWTKIIWLIMDAIMLDLIIKEWNLLRETEKLNDDIMGLAKRLHEMPQVIPCYECRFYSEDATCPKSGMQMKEGLIYCCYGEREDSEDEG